MGGSPFDDGSLTYSAVSFRAHGEIRRIHTDPGSHPVLGTAARRDYQGGDGMHPPLPEEMPLYVFAELDEEIGRRLAKGETVYDLTKSDPAHDPPEAAVRALYATADEELAHHYPPFAGTQELRQSVARWYERRARLRLDPSREVFILQGSKEGIVHLASALVRPGETVLVPDPAFPAYETGARLAGARTVSMPLRAEKNFLPDIREALARATSPVRLLYLNYPNNPTGAIASQDFFADVAELARDHGFWVCHDFAYAEIYFETGDVPPSFLAAPGAREVGLETISWSKTYAMQGYRLGALVGHPDAMAAFARVETNVMAGCFLPIQAAGRAVMDDPKADDFARLRREGYRRRLGHLLDGFRQAGWDLPMPRATVYLWVPTPDGLDGERFARTLLDEGQVAVSPGTAFGPSGHSYVRLSATAPDSVTEIAAQHIRDILHRHGWSMPRGVHAATNAEKGARANKEASRHA